MKRIPLAERPVPGISRGDEIFSMVVSIVIAGISIILTVLFFAFSFLHHNYLALFGGLFCGLTIIFRYTISAVYHGLINGTAKKVFQILDHCSTYMMIIGVYFLFAFIIAQDYIQLSIISAAAAFAVSTVGIVFSAIDFKTYSVLANGSMGAIGLAFPLVVWPLYVLYGKECMIYLIAGGLLYVVSLIFFLYRKKIKGFGGIYRIISLLAILTHFTGVFVYCVLKH